MALINPCQAGNAKNTGSECSDAMRATAILFMMPSGVKWTASDELDFTSYLKTQIHAPVASRWYPIFGLRAPISSIVDGNEADVLETMEDGSMQFIRNGMYNRTFITNKGGLCLAQALSAMNQNYSFVEVDIEGKVNRMENSDGTFSGFPVNLAYAPTPELANLKTSYKNKFYLSFSKVSYIDNGGVVKGDATEDILSLRGLYDTQVVKATTTQTTTNIFVTVSTICGGSDLTALYPTALPVAGNFIITKVSDGSVVTPSAVAIVGSTVRFTGTFTSSASYYVALAAASVLKAAGIEGYEGIKKATVPIP